MTLYMVYRPNSENERKALNYMRDFEKHTGHKMVPVDLDTKEGDSKAANWDIVRYPAIVAARTDGAAVMVWQEEMLPTFSEAGYYASSSFGPKE